MRLRWFRQILEVIIFFYYRLKCCGFSLETLIFFMTTSSFLTSFFKKTLIDVLRDRYMWMRRSCEQLFVAIDWQRPG